MDSNKSSVRRPVVPQRSNGKRRLAELLQAAREVIAERGFEAATMAEIAARAGAPIGSLYRFFPNKEAVADALVEDALDLIDGAFAELAGRAAGLASAELADALLDLMVELRGRTRSILALAEVGGNERRSSLRGRIREHIAGVLARHRPGLDPTLALDAAQVLQHAMKLMASFVSNPELGVGPGARAELRTMTRLYLETRLGSA